MGRKAEQEEDQVIHMASLRHTQPARRSRRLVLTHRTLVVQSIRQSAITRMQALTSSRFLQELCQDRQVFSMEESHRHHNR